VRKRMVLTAVALAGLYALGAQLVFWFLEAPEAGAAFFPPAGLTVATLMLTPRRTWPVWLAAFAVAEVSIDLIHGQTPGMALGFAAANVLEPVVGASLIILLMKAGAVTRRGSLARFVAGPVAAGPVVGALIGAGVATVLADAQFGSTFGRWWLGDALGVLVVATPIVAWKRRLYEEAPASLTEDALIAAVAALVVIVPGLFSHFSVAYAVLPVLMFAALRGGAFGVAVSGFAVAFSADWIVATNRAESLFPLRSPERMLVELQVFLAVTLLAALVFAVEVAERTRAERSLREAERERAQQQLLTVRAVARERERMARETHDIVGHALNVMLLSAGAARRVLDHDPDAATELLGQAETVGRDAFRDLDAALGLGDGAPELAPGRGLGDLDELVARLNRAGLEVEVECEGTAHVLPRMIDMSAYRIIQESLTNVAKHTEASHTRVQVRYEPDLLVLTVADDGHGTTGKQRRNGRGIIGMRERVAMLGGYLEAGPNEAGGFEVHAELPIEARSR
jgi:signal transduction histidine kinase